MVNPSQLRMKLQKKIDSEAFAAEDVLAAVKWLRLRIQKYSYTTEEGGYGPDVIDVDELDDLIDRAFYDVAKMKEEGEKYVRKK